MTSRSLVSARPVRPCAEGGFALLVIFLMAAAVAFTMYQELPRAAFESARDKEQLLMDRGNQYKRAIQIYYAVNKRYPADLKDLENTNEKRFLRRRYKDPMTGEDQWRLIHTNGSFLTDSLVQKPPAQNASNGLPGAGQTPGGGPLGANNLNTASAAMTNTPNTGTNNPNDLAFQVTTPGPQNAAAQRRPSDRGFPAGPGFPQAGTFNAPNQNPTGIPPFGPNPANFNPDDPSTWPPITLATPTQLIVNGSPASSPSQPGAASQAFPNQAFPGQSIPPLPPAGQAFQPTPGIPGQLPGIGGANPQQMALANSNPLGQNSLTPALPQTGNQNPPQISINQDGQLAPLANQPSPGLPPTQPFNGGQPSNPSQAFNAGQSFNGAPPFTPPTPATLQRPVGQPNPASPASPSNAALDAINNQLFRPNQAPAANGPVGSPGIAGVASKFEGPSIKAYRERTKYQEWEFVYEPGANQPGQTGAPGQNQPLNPNGQTLSGSGQNIQGQTPGQNPGQTPSGTAPPNPFTQPNMFSPQNPFAPQSPPR
jgi:hypothetical protein